MTVYVLRHDKLVKIGFTQDLRTRVLSLISISPVPVSFVGHMPGGREVERHFHDVFAQFNLSGEWFVETEQMKAVFSAILCPDLPEPEPKSKKRTADKAMILKMAERIREKCAERWPNTPVGSRVELMASELGWNLGRSRDLYYTAPRMALRAWELEELNSWLSKEAAA